jgi:hypothetical protein
MKGEEEVRETGDNERKVAVSEISDATAARVGNAIGGLH